ncbi:hypothetical protein Nmel_001928 [Mimus melanotis]
MGSTACREAFMGGSEAVGLVAGPGVSRGLRVWDLEVPGSQENRRVVEGTRASRAGRGHAGAPGGFRGLRTGSALCDPRLLPSCGTSCWSTTV